MPEVASIPDGQGAANNRKGKAGMALGLVGLAVALAFYLRLFLLIKIDGRTEVFDFFFRTLLPAAAIHTAIFLALALGFRLRARGMMVFWALSAAALLWPGGGSKAAALVLIVLFGFVLTRVGLVAARWLLPPESAHWGIALSLAIVALSAAGAFLAWAHLFNCWTLALLLLLALGPDLRTRLTSVRDDFRAGWGAFLQGWNLPLGLVLQGMFLLGAFAYVAAMAPETNSDAVRFYWPYMKLLRHYSGFFDGQRQWCYIIPQAGLIYGSALLSLLGDYAVRLSMLLAWAALIGTACRRFPGQPATLRYALALVLASSPVVLWVASSLMLDTFVCVAVVALAVLCIEGREPGSARFWVAVGICAGTAWAAKFSSLPYIVPLVGYAAFRAMKAAGVIRMIRGMALSGVSLLVTLSPWFVHSYQQSGNPIFPFLLKVFPSPFWPRGVGFSNLGSFRLSGGWRGWLLWPIDMTYHTGKFVEGFDGKLGLILLVSVFLAVLILWKGTAPGRALVLATIVATAILWSQTAYVRYWLPSLWLIALAACYPMKKPARTAGMPAVIAGAALLVMMPQVLFSMVDYWPDPLGWPWKVYARKISPASYLGGRFEALTAEIEHRAVLGNRFPKMWFTGYEAIGQFPVQPMEAVVWELALHTLGPRPRIEYLISAGCEYWLVNEEANDALWFRAEGISHFFWNESNLIARSGPLAIYRMPARETVLRAFDARAAAGTELMLNGSFESVGPNIPLFWLTKGDTPPQQVTSPQAFDGKQYVQLRLKSGLQQGIALPPGLKNVELLIHARSVQGEPAVSFRYKIYSLGFEKDPASVPPESQVQPELALTGKEDSISVRGDWQEYRINFAIPELARYVIVSLDKPDGSGEIWVDSIHLYAR